MKKTTLFPLLVILMIALPSCTPAELVFVVNETDSEEIIYVDYIDFADTTNIMYTDKVIKINRRAFKRVNEIPDFKKIDKNTIKIILPAKSTLLTGIRGRFPSSVSRLYRGQYKSNELVEFERSGSVSPFLVAYRLK